MAQYTLGVCYPNKDDPDLRRVIDITSELSKSKSEVARKLINRGLAHTHNPNPLFPEAEEPAKTTRREHKLVTRPTSVVSVEPVSGEQSQLRPSGDKLSPGYKADRVIDSTPALDKKKSPQKDKSNLGWIALGVLGVSVFTWVVTRFVKV